MYKYNDNWSLRFRSSSFSQRHLFRYFWWRHNEGGWSLWLQGISSLGSVINQTGFYIVFQKPCFQRRHQTRARATGMRWNQKLLRGAALANRFTANAAHTTWSSDVSWIVPFGNFWLQFRSNYNWTLIPIPISEAWTSSAELNWNESKFKVGQRHYCGRLRFNSVD